LTPAPKELLRSLFQTAALMPQRREHCVPPNLPAPPQDGPSLSEPASRRGRMAKAVERHWPADRRFGLGRSRGPGKGVPLPPVEVIEAGHPSR
jgi:hydroxypyruvate reductase